MNYFYGEMATPAHSFGYWVVYSLGEIFGALLGLFFFFCARTLKGKAREGGAPAVFSEWIGTFVLCMTVHLVVNGSPGPLGALGIASSLMVMIYSLGAVSGANFNPAVSIALLVTGNLPFMGFIGYFVIQLMAAIGANGLASLFLWGNQKVTLTSDTLMSQYGTVVAAGTGDWWSIVLAEFIFTTVLVLTVLNVAVSDASNQYYGLAIGFVIVVGGASVGSVSGGAFNPAVALSLDLAGLFKGVGFGWSFVYMLIELLAGIFAALIWKLCRIEDPEFEGMEKELDEEEEDYEGEE